MTVIEIVEDIAGYVPRLATLNFSLQVPLRPGITSLEPDTRHEPDVTEYFLVPFDGVPRIDDSKGFFFTLKVVVPNRNPGMVRTNLESEDCTPAEFTDRTSYV